jgi:hypothetical protein
MKITNSTFLYTAAVIIGIGLLTYAVFAPDESENTDPIIPTSSIDAQELAQCLTDEGVKFYYANWCSHCETQIEMFGDAFDTLDSYDCAFGVESGFNQECLDLEISSVPTWVFNDETRASGVQTFEALDRRVGCGLAESDEGFEGDEGSGEVSEIEDQPEVVTE